MVDCIIYTIYFILGFCIGYLFSQPEEKEDEKI